METSSLFSSFYLWLFPALWKAENILSLHPNCTVLELFQGRLVSPPGWAKTWGHDLHTHYGFFAHMDSAIPLRFTVEAGSAWTSHDRSDTHWRQQRFFFVMKKPKHFLISLAALGSGNLDSMLHPRKWPLFYSAQKMSKINSLVLGCRLSVLPVSELRVRKCSSSLYNI